MDILEQVQTMLNEEQTEQDENYRELLRALFRQHDAYVAKQDWHGAYLAMLEILKSVMKQRERHGIT